MAGIRLIKQRIKSAKNIAQITKAMQMVAASKMRKAQQTAIAGRPYAEKIYQAVAELTKIADSSYHQLLSQQPLEAKKSLIILISTNKGLCGSLNTNLFRNCLRWFNPPSDYDFIGVGMKGVKFVLKAHYNLLADFSQSNSFLNYAPAIIDLMIKKFLTGNYKEVLVVYNSFINALNIVPVKTLILPLSQMLVESSETHLTTEFLIEPNPKELLDWLLPHYLETLVRNAIIQAEASEHSARMLAMKNATDNAVSLQEELTLVYNKLRQEQITYEIADITRAQLSFKS